MKCLMCGIEVESKRTDAKFCSPKCRVTFSRKSSVVTDNVTFSDKEDVTFNFKIVQYNLNTSKPERKPDFTNRAAKYWYDVPLGAIPIVKPGWPAMPDFMNGRQYFLWWKNNFETGTGEDPFNGPILWNPFR